MNIILLRPWLYSNNRSKFHSKFFFGAFYFSKTSPYGPKVTIQHCGSMKFYVHVFLLPFVLKRREKPYTNHHYIKPFGHYHYTKQQIISSWFSRVGNSFINDSMWHIYHSHPCQLTDISYISIHFNTMPPRHNVIWKLYFVSTLILKECILVLQKKSGTKLELINEKEN